MATIYPVANNRCNPSKDAQALHDSYTDQIIRKKEIAYILCNRSNAQRYEIRKAFQENYNVDLVDFWQKDIKSCPFLDTAIALVTPQADWDAANIYYALKGLGTDEQKLMEVLFTRTFDQITAMREAYTRLYKKNMDKEIKDDVSGNFGKLLDKILTAPRPTDPADPALAKEDAVTLYKSGEGKFGTDDKVWIEIFTSRSYSHLRVVFQEYEKEYNKPFEKAVSKETSGDFKKALLCMMTVIHNQGDVVAEQLHTALNGKKTQDDLIRLIVGHCESDLSECMESYKAMYNKDFIESLKEKITDDFLMILLTLV